MKSETTEQEFAKPLSIQIELVKALLMVSFFEESSKYRTNNFGLGLKKSKHKIDSDPSDSRRNI